MSISNFSIFCPLGSALSRFVRGISVKSMQLNSSLKTVDSELFSIIEKEKDRQRKNLNLIASENFAPKYILDAIGSVMTNKYSEGYPGARYYAGNEFIDVAERLCQKRALETFGLNADDWGVNVQTLSGAPCNFAVYTALLEVHDRIMALDLPHGGHLSHGYQTDAKKVSMVSKFWTSMPYRLNEETGLIDYDECQLFASRFRPKILICGASAYPRHIDYAKFRQIADSVGALLMCDMAHIAGLIAGKALPSPFGHCDIVTTTTHKSLRGPRGSMIFYRKGKLGVDKNGNAIMFNLEDRINSTVFPGLQGGPHNHTISAIAASLKMAQTPEFAQYQKQVVSNCQSMSKELARLGHVLVSGGTDNHLLLLDLKPFEINARRVELVCEMASITLNKNTIIGDKSAISPSGLRIGSPAMTSRGLVDADFEKVAQFIDRAIRIGVDVQANNPNLKKFAEFAKFLNDSEPVELIQLRMEVEKFASGFDTIGF